MSGTFLSIFSIQTTTAHHLLPLPPRICRPFSSNAHRSQVQKEINNSWVCKHAPGAVVDDDALVRSGCRCAQDEDKLGHNGIKITDGIIWPEFVERTQTDRKIQGRMTHTEYAVKSKKKKKGGERKEVAGQATTRLIRFYRLTGLKGWSCLLSSDMPGGEQPYM